MTEVEVQEGGSTLIIGRGRVGKSGFTFDLVEEEFPDEPTIILAPRRTIIKKMEELDYTDEPIMSANQLVDIWNDHVENGDGPLLVLIYEQAKGQPSIWKILQDPRFKNFIIHAEELAVLTSKKEDWDAFDVFIRVVGQSNQHFYANTHRLRADIDPSWLANFQKIYVVGQLADEQEVQTLYGACNISTKMTLDEFREKLKNQPEKYEWWARQPNPEAAFLIYA